jgi:GWxTD domain-containing protein
MAAQRLRSSGVCAAPAVWRATLDRLADRMAVARPMLLLESCLTEAPVLIGYLRPAILMPMGLLAGLPPEQVESILLHELAHIRRHDYLVNLLQTIMEGLLFYHPAVWWISSVVRLEREHCCDDLVVATQGDAFGYASALAALEERRTIGGRAVLASTGGSVVERVRRLLAAPEGPRAGIAPILCAMVLTLTVAGVLAAWPSRPLATPAPPPTPAQVIPTLPAPAARAVRPVEIARAEPPAQQQDQSSTKVESPYRKWLNQDVAYIITDEERSAFKRLQTDAEYEQFIEQFWKLRDPTPGTVENEFKEEHYRRIAYANERFASSIPGWKTDRGRIYITYGPPDEIDSHPNGEANATPSNTPFEQWRYRFIEGIGNNIIIEFVDRERNGEYHMNADPTVMFGAAAREFDTVRRLQEGGGRSGSIVALHLGATADVVKGTNGVRLSVPLSRFGSHTVSIYVQITKGDRTPVAAIEETSTGQLVFSRFLALNPGAYRVHIAAKDITTGTLAVEIIPIEVR